MHGSGGSGVATNHSDSGNEAAALPFVLYGSALFLDCHVLWVAHQISSCNYFSTSWLFLVLGAFTSQLLLMLPWLIGQGLLAVLLASFALYYLILYPQSHCQGINSSSDCTLLLWHSVIMVLSLLLLIYYIYVVADFVAQLRSRKEKDARTLEQMYTIERQEKTKVQQQVEWQQQVLSDSKERQQHHKQQQPILNERGLLQQLAQPTLVEAFYHPPRLEVAPDPGHVYTGPNPAAVPVDQQYYIQQQQGGHRLVSVLPTTGGALSNNGDDAPYYENQRQQQQLQQWPVQLQQVHQHQHAHLAGQREERQRPLPPPRPRKPQSDEADQPQQGHYENAGYVQEGSGNIPRDVTSAEAKKEDKGGQHAAEEEVEKSVDEKKKKRVRIFDPGSEEQEKEGGSS